MSRALVIVVLALAAATAGTAGPSSAQMPQSPRPPSGSSVFVANICWTQWGWCNLQGMQMVNTDCACLTAANQPVAGISRSFPTTGPVSPYLRPHTGPSQ